MRPVLPTPSGEPPKIGPRLRAARTHQSLTIADVAEAAGVTKSFVSRLERDEASPSVATLVALCEVLSLDIGSLFATPERQVISLASAPPINMGGSGVTERLLTPRTQSRNQILWSKADPGASGGAELYTLNCETETLIMLEGSITLEFSDEQLVASAGDSITFAGGDPHTWKNVGADVATFLWVISPAPWSGSE